MFWDSSNGVEEFIISVTGFIDINTGLRSNATTPALALVRCGGACNLSWITKGNPAASCPVTLTNQAAFYSSRKATLNHI
jgi:hypothetical protein